MNYFIGKEKNNWRSNILSYESISVGEIYKGIGLTLKAYGNNVEKLFTVSPGESSAIIRVKLKGAKGLKVNEKGELVVITELAPVKFTRPLAYQNIAGNKKIVDVAYVIYEGNKYGFQIGSYDKKIPLIIDPLLASTFVGGWGWDEGNSIAIDGSGNVYVTGRTYFSDYPTTLGAFGESHNGGSDVFVSKLDGDLSFLLASTFIGGSEGDLGNSITIDGSGNVYVTGSTWSTDYPTTLGAFDESHNGGSDVFVSKLNGDLSSLLASTFIGGSDGDLGWSITIDAGGNVYVTGSTESFLYPVTSRAFDESLDGASDIFVSKLDGDLSSLPASTFIGGSGAKAWSIAIDGSGNVYVTGSTRSTDYPVTIGAFDEGYNGAEDVFVSKLNSDLSSLLASTFVGGRDGDLGYSIAIDGSGNVYVTGSTRSTDYPVTSGAFDEAHNGGRDVFISKLDSYLSSLPASTFIGGSESDYCQSIAIDGSGDVYISGATRSADYPTTSGAFDESLNGGLDDVFTSKLDSALTSLLASTFIGATDSDHGDSITIDGGGNVYVTGSTGFPLPHNFRCL